MLLNYLPRARQAFTKQRYRAHERGVFFLFTFEEWLGMVDGR